MTPLEIAAQLLAMAVNLVGKETVRNLIDQETVKAGDLAADAAELAKFGKTSHTK